MMRVASHGRAVLGCEFGWLTPACIYRGLMLEDCDPALQLEWLRDYVYRQQRLAGYTGGNVT